MSIRQRNAHFTDWAAVCRALNVATESEARTALESSDNPFYYYVCYIKSTKEIYTHGQFYNCAEHEDLLHLIQTLAEEVTENEEVTARTLAELSENKASRGDVEMLDLCKQDNISDLTAIRDGAYKGATAVQPSSLATVATSGNYSDLTNKPAIPAAVTESTVRGWGFTKNTGTYSKPSGGIPKSDLASAVQTSLNKADTALQSYTEQYRGTVNAVKIDNVAKDPSSGLVDLGYINKQLSTSTSDTMTLSPNIYYRNTNISLSKLTITLGSISNSNIINEYFVEFTISSSGTTVSLPSTVKWANGSAPTFDAGCTYQVSIVNNLGTYIKFA